MAILLAQLQPLAEVILKLIFLRACGETDSEVAFSNLHLN